MCMYSQKANLCVCSFMRSRSPCKCVIGRPAHGHPHARAAGSHAKEELSSQMGPRALDDVPHENALDDATTTATE